MLDISITSDITEITDITQLTEVKKRLALHWGEMGKCRDHRRSSSISVKSGEIDPTIDQLRLCISELHGGNAAMLTRDRGYRRPVNFFGDVDMLYRDIYQFPVTTLKTLVKARGTVRKLLSSKTGR